jgi:LmbE family N-acetylglucosaminyl deacetylase
VKLVSVTNGDIGHWQSAGGPLAQLRKAEVIAADKVLGVETEVLDIHDGELLPTLENRKQITRIIGSGRRTSSSLTGRGTIIPITDTPAFSCRTRRSW